MFKKCIAFTLALSVAIGFTPIVTVPFAHAKTTTTIRYFLPDHLGGVDKVLDEAGNVVQDNDYLPFGQDRTAPTEKVTDYGFTGKEKDAETDLHNYGARYYDSSTGRFTSVDPVVLGEGGKPLESLLADPQQLNPYSYAGNNPLKYTDPTGEYKMASGEVEKGDTLTSVSRELNGQFGTQYNVADFSKFNGNARNIKEGDKIYMGAYNDDGSVWQRAYDAAKVTEKYWNKLNDVQEMITNYGRNLFQTDLPKTWETMVSQSKLLQTLTGKRGWIQWLKNPAHNLAGSEGNVDIRGNGVNAGKQAVYDKNGNLVTSPENMGTFDFGASSLNEHKTLDIQPWIKWGNSPADTTTRTERENALPSFLH